MMIHRQTADCHPHQTITIKHHKTDSHHHPMTSVGTTLRITAPGKLHQSLDKKHTPCTERAHNTKIYSHAHKCGDTRMDVYVLHRYIRIPQYNYIYYYNCCMSGYTNIHYTPTAQMHREKWPNAHTIGLPELAPVPCIKIFCQSSSSPSRGICHGKGLKIIFLQLTFPRGNHAGLWHGSPILGVLLLILN